MQYSEEEIAARCKEDQSLTLPSLRTLIIQKSALKFLKVFANFKYPNLRSCQVTDCDLGRDWEEDTRVNHLWKKNLPLCVFMGNV